MARERTPNSIHDGHKGEIKCKLRANDAVYWPGIYKDIEDIKTCSACQEFMNAQTKCPMVEEKIPPHPWHTLGADLFEVNGKWFLLVTDCFSKSPFVRPVPNTGAPATVKALKNIMGENGVPVKLISDNGPHFSTQEFSKFAKEYGFEIILSSPRYARGHALIERHVQTVEKCMRKCMASGRDFDLALLALRATPLDATLRSPGEILNGRKYRSTVPEMTKTSVCDNPTRERLVQKQKCGAQYYNRSVRCKEELYPGQSVRLYDLKQKIWEPATVVALSDTPRSYIVQRLGGGVPLRRNRIHIRTTAEKWNVSAPLAGLPSNPSPSRAVQPPTGASSTMCPEEVAQPALQKRQRRQTVFYQAAS